MQTQSRLTQNPTQEWTLKIAPSSPFLARLEEPLACNQCGSSRTGDGPPFLIIKDQGQVLWRGCPACWEETKVLLKDARLLQEQKRTIRVLRTLLLEALDLRTWQTPRAYFERVRVTLGVGQSYVL